MPSRSNDAIFDALDRGADAIAARIAEREITHPIILIDGRSGGGKSSLSRMLLARLPDSRSTQILALDDIYPGWDGLAAGAEHVLTSVLTPLRAGKQALWQSWDWVADAPGATHVIRPATGLIVEGSGILTPRSALLADLAVWVEAPDADRKRRALARDGATYEPHWQRWAVQEDEHIRAHAPQELADIRIEVPAL